MWWWMMTIGLVVVWMLAARVRARRNPVRSESRYRTLVRDLASRGAVR